MAATTLRRAEMTVQAFGSTEDVALDEASPSDRSTRLPRASTPAPHTRPNLWKRFRDGSRSPTGDGRTMKHVRPIVPGKHLEPVRDVLAQLGPVVLGELLGARRGPFGLHTVDLKGGVEPIDERGKERGLETAETHPFSVGTGVDVVKGCTAVEAVASAWLGEVGGVVVGVEEGKGGDVAGARDLCGMMRGGEGMRSGGGIPCRR